MKLLNLKFCLNVLILLICIHIQSFAANIIPNPGFELGSGDDFTSWSKWNGASSLLATTTSGEYRSGSRALKAVVASDGNPWNVQLVSDLIPTIIGESYTFTVYVKGATGGTHIRFSTNPSALYSSDYTVTTDWTQLSWTFTANETQTRIALDLGANANTYYLDDMEMMEPIEAPNVIPNPGFELGTGDDFTNWSKWNGASSLLATTTAGEYRSGSRALKAVVASDGNPWAVQLVSDLIPTQIGESYTFKIYVKALNGGTHIRFSTNPNALYSSNYTVTTAWTQLSWTFTANAAQTRIALDLGANADTYYLDDMEMLEPVNTNPNLILNGDFESGAADDFTNWSKWNGASSLLATTVAGEYFSGSRALKAVVASDGNPWDIQMVSDVVPTVIGASYSFKIYVKAASSGTHIRFSTNPNAKYSSDYTVSTDWTPLSWTFIANAAQTRLALDLGANANTYFLDDASLQILCGVTNYTPPADQVPIASGKNKFIGTVYSASDPDINKYFNQITPENEGKWGSIETSDGVFNWTNIDAARKYAKDNNFPFRFHVLVWGSQQPTWLKPLSDSEKVIRIKRWFQSVADHFDGSSNTRAVLEYVEVVNEALNDPPDNLGANASDNGSGDYLNALRSLNTELGTTPGKYDWVVNAFKLARKYFPCETKLMLNDYRVENEPSMTAKYDSIIQLLKNDNLIDVIGIQCHSFNTQKYGSGTYEEATANLEANLNTLAAEGLPIMVTEFDIDGNVSLDENGNRVTIGTDAEKDEFQRSEYERIFSVYWDHPSVIGITLWGYRPGMWRTAQAAYLMEPCVGAERPAMSSYLNTTIRNAGNPPLSSNFIPLICGIPDDIKVLCSGDMPPADPGAITVTTINCPGTPNITVNDEITQQTAPDKYTITRTWTVTDLCDNVNTAHQIIIVDDTVKPTIICPVDTTVIFDPVVCGNRYNVPNPEISDNCGTVSKTWTITQNNVTEASGTGDIGTYTFGLGTSIITYTATDASGNSDTCSHYVTVTALPVTPLLSITPESQQYSDKITLKVVIPNGASSCGDAAESASFTLTNGIRHITETTDFTVNGTDLEAKLDLPLFESPDSSLMAPGVKTVSVTINGTSNPNYIVGTAASKTVTVLPEDAKITFTGPQFVATKSTFSKLATLTLRASVQDITATEDANGDTDFGDIRKAKVRFLNDNIPIVISGVTDSDGWILNDIVLVDSTDIKTGVISMDWPVNIGDVTEMEFNLGMEVGGYYTSSGPAGNTMITVYKPGKDLVSGDGNVIITRSAGKYTSDPNRRLDFDFNLQYSKFSKSLTGNANIQFHKTENGVLKTYKISAHEMKSLGVNSSDHNAQTAVFVANAKLIEIVRYRWPVVIGDNLTLQVNVTDKGFFGRNDEIAVSLYSGNSLWFSSNWTGTDTEPLKLNYGNILVHGEFDPCNQKSSSEVNLTNGSTNENSDLLRVMAWPNPARSNFTLNVQSDDRTTEVELDVYDIMGNLIYTVKGSPNTTYTFGETFRSGTYFIDVRQGTQRSTMQLIKE